MFFEFDQNTILVALTSKSSIQKGVSSCIDLFNEINGMAFSFGFTPICAYLAFAKVRHSSLRQEFYFLNQFLVESVGSVPHFEEEEIHAVSFCNFVVAQLLILPPALC